MARKRKYKGLPKGITIIDGYLYIKLYLYGSKNPPYMKCYGYYSLGRPTPEMTQRRQAAVEELERLRHQKRLGRLGVKGAYELRLSECRDKFLATKPDTKTKSEYQRSITKFINRVGDMLIHEIKPSHIKEYRKIREGMISHYSKCPKIYKAKSPKKTICDCTKEVKKSTVNRELTAVQACLSWIIFEVRSESLSYKIPEFNPVAYVHKPSEHEFKRTRILSKEELTKLKHACKNDLKLWDIIRACLITGARLADLKNFKQNGNVSGVQVKTGNPYNFGAIEGIPLPLDFSNFPKRLKKVMGLAKLPYWQFRDLRRTAANISKEAGMSLEVISDFLGHSSSKITTTYLNVPSPAVVAVVKNNQSYVDGL